IPVPESAEMVGILEDQFIFQLRKEWSVNGANHLPGEIISFSVSEFLKNENKLPPIYSIFVPTKNLAAESVSLSSEGVYLTLSQDVISVVKFFDFKNGQWNEHTIHLPKGGSLRVVSANSFAKAVFFNFEDFTTPDSLYVSNQWKEKPKKIKTLPSQFKDKGFVSNQYFATSKDGTKVPYFVIHKKGLKFTGDHPTLQYGYGGFEYGLQPFYSGGIGKAWLEKGGVYVVANIRGGGEYGPEWHQAALKTHRQKAYDDFIAVSEDLIQRKITNPQKLAIKGGSNGGLLVGAVFIQRPDLYQAVICQVPLLDMLRFHKLLAGASWVGEYGSPENADERAAILKYSPYQNVKKDQKYPEVLFITSTKDDRVHPGHARKMVARMQEFGHKVYYYETIEGGHSTAANMLQYAEQAAIQYIYLYKQLGMK
ncbi:MAG: S9 family peptidase, partial [Bdellovibrionales bacterium]|nr:S9 family peptidase [Bdellovibrionales bacterium]